MCSEISIKAGADFIKPLPVKCAAPAGKRAHHDGSDPRHGRFQNRYFKPAGGVRMPAEDAQKFLAIADELFGADWADSRHYRFGASSLLAC